MDNHPRIGHWLTGSFFISGTCMFWRHRRTPLLSKTQNLLVINAHQSYHIYPPLLPQMNTPLVTHAHPSCQKNVHPSYHNCTPCLSRTHTPLAAQTYTIPITKAHPPCHKRAPLLSRMHTLLSRTHTLPMVHFQPKEYTARAKPSKHRLQEQKHRGEM